MLTVEQYWTKFSYKMILSQPFYGKILCRLKQALPTKAIDTAAASMTQILYNRDFYISLLESVEGEAKANWVSMHELLHIIFRHPEKKKDAEIPELHNIVADLVVNQVIADDVVLKKGVPMVAPEFLYLSTDPQYIRDRTTESLYKECYKQFLDQGGDEKALYTYVFKLGNYEFSLDIFNLDLFCSNDHIEGVSLSEEDKNFLKDILAGVGGKLPGNLPGSLVRELEEYFGQRIKWSNWVRRWLNSKLSEEESFDTPNKNFLWRKMILPGVFEEDSSLQDLLITIDCSGSTLTKEILGEFFFHIKNLIQEFEVSGRVILWDTEVKEDLSLEDFMKNPKFSGGGGTIYEPVVNYINKKYKQSLLVITLTDGYFADVAVKCRIPQLFVVTSTVNKVKNEVLEKMGKVCYL